MKPCLVTAFALGLLLGAPLAAGTGEILAALRSRQFASALEQCARQLQTQPTNPLLWLYQGLAQQNLGKTTEALASYRRAVKLDPASLPALEAEAQLEYKVYDGAARETLQRIVRLHPGSAPAHGMLGALAYEKKDCTAAAAHFEKAGQAVNSNPLALWQYGTCLYQLRRPDEAADRFRRSLEGMGEQAGSDAVRYNLGLSLLEAKRPKDAIDALRPLTAPARPDSEALSLLAAAYEAGKQTPEALAVLRRAADLYPLEERHYIDFASMCMDHSSLEVGIEVLEVGIGNIPTSARLYAILGALEVHADHMERAETLFAKAQQMDPKMAHGDIGLSLAMLQSAQVDESIRILRKQWAQRQVSPMISFMLAQSLLRKEGEPGKPEFEEAQQMLRRTLELDPNHARAHALLGKNYAAAGQTAKAIAELNAALRLNPDERTAAYQLALLYRKTGRPDLSEKWDRHVRDLIESARVSAIADNKFRILRSAPSRASDSVSKP